MTKPKVSDQVLAVSPNTLPTLAHVNTGDSRANIDLLLKAVPIIALVIYVIGYLIRLTYFRNINVHTVEFLKAESLETGVSFAVISAVLLALVAVVPLVLLMQSLGYRVFPPHVSLTIGMLFTIAALVVIILTSLTIIFFAPPQHFQVIRDDFVQMLLLFFALITIVVAISKAMYSQWISQHQSTKKLLPLVADVVRLTLLGLVCYYAYLIFFQDVKECLYVFEDSGNLFYLVFLLLFAFAAARFAWRLLRLIAPRQQESVPGGHVTDPTAVVKTQWQHIAVDRLALFVLGAFASVLFYLVVISYTFGPFLYISTSRGGGMQYCTVQLLVRDPNVIPGALCQKGSTKISLPTYLLGENDSWVYLAPYNGAQRPRDAFQAMSKGRTYTIDRKEILQMMFDKVK